MTYYNENDPQMAAWLRELIKAGLIPNGHVDERSIVDVRPHELTEFVQQHFFAGISGWSLALRLAGWPDDTPVRTGSCPCQPFSQAGKRKAQKDPRHLWPHFRDLITFGEATITFGEQVASPLGREWLARVRADMEALGYAFGAADLCAAGVGAPHLRQRLYWVANPQGKGRTRMDAKLTQGIGGRTRARSGGAIDGMVQPDSDGRISGQSPATPDRHGGPTEPAGGTNRVDNPHSNRAQRSGPGEQEPDAGREAKWLGEPNHSGPQGWNERIFECPYQWPPGSPNLVVLCQDGKARRFEPGSQPLAHRVPNRVGLLRGYGNAIVPQLAAEFILATLESL